MKPSILRTLFISYIGFGLAMGLLFPLYAQLFVEWKPGMQLWFNIGCILAGLSIGVANYWVCRQVLLKRLRRISEVAHAISNNDISHQCTMVSHDLIGEIVKSFNQMAANLRQMIGRIDHSSQALDNDIEQLVQIANQGREQAARQQEESGQVVQVVEQISGGITRLSEMADTASGASEQAEQHASQGILIATEAIGSISALLGDVDKAGKVIAQLDEKSASIGMVMDVIRNIAEQTNLLALNAAIEAARAGEQGRGFAVVADEVRTLATRTQKSTEEIEEIIRHLQSGSREAVEVMNHAHQRAMQTEEHFEQAAELLAEISGSISTMRQVSQEVAEASNEQGSLIKSVKAHSKSIDSSSRHNAGDANLLAESSQRLSEQAHGLQEMLARFRQ
ncbi:MAG: methyl-accepting chemotaxis protein [Sedimenticola sp.]|nr:methyl-accepting chemotaxis protein [Sedimenticola sp.]